MEGPDPALPKGGGAIRPSANDFTVNLSTGSGTMPIPISLPAGRSNHTPDLALTYASGAGNGAFGIGFTLAVPRIERGTKRRLASYRDDRQGVVSDDADGFTLVGGDELVPVLDATGAPEELTRTIGAQNFAIRRFRPRTEAAFSRIERWRRADGDIHWRITSATNEVSVFGPDAASRLSDPANPNHVAAWLLAQQVDDRGDMIAFDYIAEDARACAGDANEAQHPSVSNRYLKSVRYGFANPVTPGAPAGAGAAAYALVVDYGDHDPADPAMLPDRDWPLRPDPFSSCRNGFDQRTRRLCRRLLVFHDFAALGQAPICVRSIDLRYLADDPAHAAEGRFASQLVGLTARGYIRGTGATASDAFPEVRFEWSAPAFDFTLHTLARNDRDPSADNLPAGVRGAGWRWIDLDGDGAQGALHAGRDGWTYRAPDPFWDANGAPHAALLPARRIDRLPAVHSDNEWQLADVLGNGIPQLVRAGPPGAGIFPRARDGAWLPMRPTPAPARQGDARTLLFADLDGDVLADLIALDGDRLCWRPSLGDRGFGELTRLVLDPQPGAVARLVRTDPRRAVYLADLSGDGLLDLCVVTNRWIGRLPNLGFGRFGAELLMAPARPFDDDARFDPRRLRLVDIDGTGPADVVYLHAEGPRIYRNRVGNGLDPAIALPPVPGSETPDGFAALDLMGTGTTCLVFSTDLPAHAGQALRYIDLLGGVKPYLLTGVDNGVGLTRWMRYAPSTRFAMEDRAAGRPWRTRLPFPVHVVDRIELFDAISRSKHVTRYSYHGAWFDPDEREFRGFSRVEAFDSEDLAAFTGVGLHSGLPEILDGSFHLPTVRTVSWFHLGDGIDPEGEAATREADFWAGDPVQPRPARPELPGGLGEADTRHLWRALRGRPVRTEVFAEDGEPAAAHPYQVHASGYRLRLLQRARGAIPASAHAMECETLSLRYERAPGDPRIDHRLVLESDPLGLPLLAASISYPRRPRPGRRAEQAVLQVRLSTMRWAHETAQPDWYRIGLPVEQSTHQLDGFTPGGACFVRSELAGADVTAEIEADVPAPGGKSRRLLAREQVLYRRDDLTGPLAPGQIQSLGLVHEKYRLIGSQGLLDRQAGGRFTPALLAEGGHVQRGGGDWWIPSGRIRYSEGAADNPATERAVAAADFFLPRATIDPFGGRIVARYDAARLFVVETIGQTGLSTRFDIHPRLGVPHRMTDANGVTYAVRLDALGQVSAIFTFDAASGEGDAYDPAGIEAAAGDDPSTRFSYANDRWRSQGLPTRATTRRRDRREPGAEWVVSHLYGDGSGREVQRKVLAASGLAPVRGPDGKVQLDMSGQPVLAPASPRWAASGRTVYDNKGNPTRTYQPFYDSSEEFTDEPALDRTGVSTFMRYDPIGRLVRTDFADGSVARAALDAWSTTSWDPNDSTLASEWWSVRGAPAASGPMPTDAAGRAAWLAARHADTPARDHVDSLGRMVASVTDLGPAAGSGRLLETRMGFDAAGNLVAVYDPTGRMVEQSRYDLVGRRILRGGIDEGFRFDLSDVAGNSLRRWVSGADRLALAAPANDLRVGRTEYDSQRRATHHWITEGAAAPALVERHVYGDAHPDAGRRLKGRGWRSYDASGLSENARYTIDGVVAEEIEQIVADPAEPPDWSALAALTSAGPLDAAAAALLGSERWRRQRTCDVLGRVTQLVTAHGGSLLPSVIQPQYDEGGRMSGAAMWLRRPAPPGALLDPATADLHPVRRIDYDARGDRERVLWGHGLETRYGHDPLSERLTRMRLGRFAADGTALGELLQDRRFFHDATGNLVEMQDVQAQVGTIFTRNRRVDPRNRYRYDAAYRLVQAEGREHVGLTGGATAAPIRSGPDDSARFAPHPHDGNALDAYAESYDYDAAGNILSVRHATGLGAWRRDYACGAPSRLEPLRTGNRLTATSRPGELPPGPFGDAYAHDAQGQVTQMPHMAMMRWDMLGQLRETRRTVGGAGPSTCYAYSSKGARTQKVSFAPDLGGVRGRRLSERLYLGDTEIHREFNPDGTIALERQSVHFLDGTERLVLVETRTVGASSGADTAPLGTPLVRYEHGDHTGSVALSLDETGAVIDYEEYFPFGGTALRSVDPAVRAAAKRYAYAGQERDEESGLCCFGARYYAPWLGRWTSPDPVFRPQRANGYCHVRNNPVSLREAGGSDENSPGWNRFMGGLRVLGGAAQTVGGAIVFVQVEVPVAAQVVGGVAVVHGVDDMQAGLRQIITGREERNATQVVVTAAARPFVENDATARAIGNTADLALGFVSPTPGANAPGAAPRVLTFGVAATTTGERILVTGTREMPAAVSLVREQAYGAQIASSLVQTGAAATPVLMSVASSGGPGGSSSSPGNSSPGSSTPASPLPTGGGPGPHPPAGGGPPHPPGGGGGTPHPPGGGGSPSPAPPSHPWTLGPFARGDAIEGIAAGGRSEARLLARNFPTIDRFLGGTTSVGGVVDRITSVKSMDLNAATYTNVSGAITSRLNRYVDSLSGFTTRTWGGNTVTAGPATERVLELVIPRSATPAQLAEIAAAEARAAALPHPVRFDVRIVP